MNDLSDIIPPSTYEAPQVASAPADTGLEDIIPSSTYAAPPKDVPVTSSKIETKEGKVEPTWTNAAKGVAQAAGAMGAGYAKNIALAFNDLLPGSPEAKAHSAEFFNKNLSYQGGPEAQPIMHALSYATHPLSEAANWAHQQISGMFGERSAQVVGDLATLAATPGGAAVIGRISDAVGGIGDKWSDLVEQGKNADHPLAGAATEEAQRLEAIHQRGLNAGYDLPEAGTQARLARASVNNIQVGANQIRQQLDLPKGAPLQPNMLHKANTQYVSPAYEEMKAIPDPLPLASAKATLDDVRPLIGGGIKLPEGDTTTFANMVDLSKKLRLRSERLWNSETVQGGYLPQELAEAHGQAADALESAAENYLRQTGRGEIADNWFQARTYRAISGSVESALDQAGNFDPKKLMRQMVNGEPLSGPIGDIAQLAAEHPEAFKLSATIKPRPGLIRRTLATAAPSVGAAVGGAAGGPWGAAAGTAAGQFTGERLLPQ